jgi:hypothetical protein
MSQPKQQPTGSPEEQRDALERSERRATTTQPQNFRDEANAEKTVEIGPDKTDHPIQGIDPEDRGRKAR